MPLEMCDTPHMPQTVISWAIFTDVSTVANHWRWFAAVTHPKVQLKAHFIWGQPKNKMEKYSVHSGSNYRFCFKILIKMKQIFCKQLKCQHFNLIEL